MGRILLVSATTGYQLRSFDAAAARLGIELVLATDRCSELDDPWRDRAIPVRFHEPARAIEAVAAAARGAPFDAVLAVGDRPAVLAARCAERLGLTGHPSDAVRASVNKLETRARFAAAGLPTPLPLAIPVAVGGAAASADRRVTFPCVLKPVGLSGSRGVIRADDPAAFGAAFDRIAALLGRREIRAQRTGLDTTIVVERFIPGREVAIEGVLTGGVLRVLAVCDKPDPLDGPFFEETIYVTPSRLAAALEARVAAAVQRAVAALGLRHGPVHAECRIAAEGLEEVEELYVLEVAPRPIGGLCSKALRFTGATSLEELLLRHARGDDVGALSLEPGGSAVMMIPIPARGRLKATHGIAAAEAVPDVEAVQITARPDQLLEPLPEAGSYLGFIFARAATAAAAEHSVRAAHRELTFTIDNRIGELGNL